MNDLIDSAEWLDVTRPITPGMTHWPGDPDVEVERLSNIDRGDSCNTSRVVLCTHTGTHIDAPLHYIRDGAAVEAAPLAVFMGPAQVIEVDDPVSIRRAHLENHDIQPGSRILFKTRNSLIDWDGAFQRDYVHISSEAAQYLAERGVVLVGVDYMSVGGFYQDMVQTHVALLGANIWVIENLDLRQVTAGEWEIICLPLKIQGGDGAPARVLMRKAPGSQKRG